MTALTYWNLQRMPCERVRVIVGEAEAGWWCAKFKGTERAAVKVTVDGRTFYIDDESGKGWLKVTVGRGSPNVGHLSLPNSSIEVKS